MNATPDERKKLLETQGEDLVDKASPKINLNKNRTYGGTTSTYNGETIRGGVDRARIQLPSREIKKQTVKTLKDRSYLKEELK